MHTIWSWVIEHWKLLGTGISVPAVLGGIGWLYEKYHGLRDTGLDKKVLDALGNHKWSRERPTTGRGMPCVGATEIADLLGKKLDEVADSLERLEVKGRVKRTERDVPPRWFIVPR